MRVFLAATSLLPAYGGPAHSVSRMAQALAVARAEVGLWARDGSALVTSLLPPESPIRRLGGRLTLALEAFGHPDIIHDNGLWLLHNHMLAVIARNIGTPRLVSVRGMLEPWAWNHKKGKKRVAWWLYQRADLMRADLLHGTSIGETSNIERFELGVPVVEIPNGVEIPVDARRRVRAHGSEQHHSPLRALFLGRIHPVKGLPMLVEAWARVRPEGWRLEIAGPDEAGHRSEVERQVRAAGLSDIVSFLGAIEGAQKQAAFLRANLFVLPSHSESFGMAIAEALSHGLPVLTTSAVPWPMLQEKGCGWIVHPSIEGIADGLRSATSISFKKLEEIGNKGFDLSAELYGWQEIAERFIACYQEIIASHVA